MIGSLFRFALYKRTNTNTRTLKSHHKCFKPKDVNCIILGVGGANKAVVNTLLRRNKKKMQWKYESTSPGCRSQWKKCAVMTAPGIHGMLKPFHLSIMGTLISALVIQFHLLGAGSILVAINFWMIKTLWVLCQSPVSDQCFEWQSLQNS